MMPESRRIKSATREGKQERKCESGGGGMVVLDRRSKNGGTRQGEEECVY
jgi:hypothetical protein